MSRQLPYNILNIVKVPYIYSNLPVTFKGILDTGIIGIIKGGGGGGIENMILKLLPRPQWGLVWSNGKSIRFTHTLFI